MIELLTPTEMQRVDRLAIADGSPGIALMERAGAQVAEAILRHFAGARDVLVLCGSGNNGGDGFIAARHLAEAGMHVRVMSAVAREALAGDAALAAQAWSAPLERLSTDHGRPDLIVDALLGAGLRRDVAGPLAAVIDAVNTSGSPVVAVDLPSGIDGATGAIRGCAIQARQTVTFVRCKPGHFLLPGRELCGERLLFDIGISDATVDEIGAGTFANRPTLWQAHWPAIAHDRHKYDRGHVGVVTGGATATGAARLAIRGAFRTGAGLVTALAPAEAAFVLAPALEGPMLRIADTADDLQKLVAERKISAVVIGPGTGVGEGTRKNVLGILATDAAVVLDADALTSFEGEASLLLAALRQRPRPTVLTPHAGEFHRLFRGLLPDAGSKLDLCRHAARQANAVVLFKGADSVVAAPDGRASIADNAPPWLATAGAGDVLTGIIAGLLAQGMPAFEAASAAVWIHGKAAADFGPGLIAEDLPDQLPSILRSFVRPWRDDDPLRVD
ncbi:bifunctional NAD(P)H-hydrate repair enzyme [Agaricicola taiwanensis]|uniref:Bifunctional NAD(P)H-hydrate repair enzyme n=1 Tax=Agaricicola taiwanensis TaxID=591372 RepID=A0A8J2YHX4_9RHOB|nr:NAD(P)H-hydrate dehydratase [Agaricicola taiwanensis]GGE44001.1 bifunctional NAD(P)H-hydrate repair enzyme [Agaricicola taiwanensis]